MNKNQSFERQWAEFTKWWGTENKEEDISHFENLYAGHPLFHTAMTMNRSLTVVVDLRAMKILFLTGDTKDVTGWEKDDAIAGGVKYMFEKVHPDDREVPPLFGQLVSQYFKSLPKEQKRIFKSYWDWRFVHSNGQSSRALAQDSILKHDADGNMILLLSFMTDITMLKTNRHNHLRMTNGLENKLYEFNQADKKLYALECPSDREIAVFRLISQGHQRKQIAADLGISLSTVKTHCQHVFEKLRTNDSVETINLLKTWGML